MYTCAHLMLVAAFLASIFCAGALLAQLASNKTFSIRMVERVHTGITVLMTLCVCILLYAFTVFDFSLQYVYQYSDKTLPIFYRLTALWAGQPGSLLFWAWSVAISGALFCTLPAYKKLSTTTKMWYWVFFLSIIAFFLLLLSAWSNPFIVLPTIHKNGLGLNPLLQNPGMIFHPPLLFLGYAGFVVPGCLALAQTLSGHLIPAQQPAQGEAPWADVSRSFILVGWALLTAGIILGAWWAYMELGWGGYWAWDPVENASLIPWLIASAYLHTAIIENYRQKLRLVNVFLMALTTISAFFATYLVRSGVIQSLHAYPEGSVGKPLLIFVGISLLLAIIIPAFSKEKTAPIGQASSKEGLLSFVAWFLLALSVIILIATLWPVIVAGAISISNLLPEFLQQRLPQKPMGLEPAFYNRTCLPLFAFIAVILLLCPFRQWKKGWHNPLILFAALAVAAVINNIAWSIGMVHPFALIATGASCGGIFGILGTFAARPTLFSYKPTLAAHGVHIGLLLIVIGVAFSGPYQSSYSFMLDKQNKATVQLSSFVDTSGMAYRLLRSFTPLAGTYTVTLNELYEGESQHKVDGTPHYRFLKAELYVWKDGVPLGILEPQIRLYASAPNQTFREVATIFTLGNELYATLSSIDANGAAQIELNINPLVNWLWIGGIFMSLFPLLGLRSRKKEQKG